MNVNKSIKVVASSLLLTMALTVATTTITLAKEEKVNGSYLAGDFHTHTFLTDGSNTEKDVVTNAFGKYGLDWMANSEHGGTSKRDPYGNNLANPIWLIM